MSKKILLIGCGQIGSRHLQAICCLREIKEIHIVDSNPDALALGKGRVQEVKERNLDTRLFWHERLNPLVAKGDLCIMATQAKGRADLIELVSGQYGYGNFLIEKMATQSIGEYHRLMDFALEKQLKIWVHCQTRNYEVHKYVKSCLDPSQSIYFSEAGGNWGLGCNGIHYADLFLYCDNASEIIPVGNSVDPILHSSKRGRDLYDLSGALYGRSKKGSQFILSYDRHHMNADVVTIISPRGRFLVDIFNGWAMQCLDGAHWEAIGTKESFLVSQTSKLIVHDILFKSKCGLPTLEECLPSHEFILTQLQPHFNRLLKRDLDYCPMT